MAKRLYIGNLNYQTTSDGLSEVFSECGEVTES
jgi:RNA recognition motif-containing protein